MPGCFARRGPRVAVSLCSRVSFAPRTHAGVIVNLPPTLNRLTAAAFPSALLRALGALQVLV
eukprot:2286901-Lingulodinium_polyedra.AAC.1